MSESPPHKPLRQEIQAILTTLDNSEISKEEQIAVYTDDVVHMAPNHTVISNKTDLLSYLKAQSKNGYAKMKHQIIELSQHEDIVLMRGKVNGTFHPADGGESSAFQTKNLFVFERVKGELKISKVIYNMSPNP